MTPELYLALVVDVYAIQELVQKGGCSLQKPLKSLLSV